MKLKLKELKEGLKLKLKSRVAPTKLKLKSLTSEAELESRYRISIAAKEEGKSLVIACLGRGYYAGHVKGAATWSHFPDYASSFKNLKEAKIALIGLPTHAGVVINDKLPYIT